MAKRSVHTGNHGNVWSIERSHDRIDSSFGRSISLVMMLQGHPGNNSASIRLSDGSVFNICQS